MNDKRGVQPIMRPAIAIAKLVSQADSSILLAMLRELDYDAMSLLSNCVRIEEKRRSRLI